MKRETMSKKAKLLTLGLVAVICACIVVICPLIANAMNASADSQKYLEMGYGDTAIVYTNNGSAKDNEGKTRKGYSVHYSVRKSKQAVRYALDLASTPMGIQYAGQVFTVTKADSYSLNYSVQKTVSNTLSTTIGSEISRSLGVSIEGLSSSVGAKVSGSVTRTLQTSYSTAYSRTISSSLSLSTPYTGTIDDGVFCLIYEILGNRWQVVITSLRVIEEKAVKHGSNDYRWDKVSDDSCPQNVVCYDTYLPTKDAITRKGQGIYAHSFANDQAMYNYLNNVNKVAM